MNGIFCQQVLLPDGWQQDVMLTVDRHGVLESISTTHVGQADIKLAGPVIPGMPNVHSHGFQALIRGLTGARGKQQDSFWTWREQMYAMAGRLTPDQLQACMSGVFAEMLCGGYTSCGEFHYLHHQPDGQHYPQAAEMSLRVMNAANDTGIALTLLPVLYCRSGFDSESVNERQRRFAHSPDAFLELFEACRKAAAMMAGQKVGIAPHSLRAVSALQLNDVVSAVAPDTPIHIHIAEQPREVEECLARLGARPVQWLLDEQAPGPNWCLVHATHMSPGECQGAAESGAVAGLCPTTEADLGDGIFPAVGWLEAGGSFAIGSDSNLVISATEELRLLEFTQRLATGRRNVLATSDESCGRFLYTHAAESGARAIGQAAGKIAVGLRADLVELDRRHSLLQGLNEDLVLDSYVFAGGADMINSVIVGGQLRVEQGRVIDHQAVRSKFSAVMQEMRSA